MESRSRILFAITSVASIAALDASGARAQVPPPDTDFVVEQFEPLPNQGANILNVGKSDVIPHLRPSFGLVFHFADDPFQIVLKSDEDKIRQRVVDYSVKAEVWASIGFFDYVDIGLVMPLVISQKAGEVVTAGNQSFDSFALGDLRIIPKVRILNPDDMSGFGLAFMLPMFLPTGDTGSYNSYGTFRIEPRLVLDYHNSGFVVAANVAFQPKGKRQVLNFQVDDSIKWGLGIEIPIVADRLALIGSLYGTAEVGVDASMSDARNMPVEVLGGVQWWFLEDWVGSIGAGSGLTSGVGAPDFRAFLAIGYTPRAPNDPDGDGIIKDDKCPNDPEDKDGFEDLDGCPDPDNDKDGVPDLSDGTKDGTGYGACRNDPEDKDGFQDQDGCPDPDNDNDGILDVSDGVQDGSGFGACRDDPEDMDLFQDQDGCSDPDNDKDGILDMVDGDKDATGFGKCRNDPETVNQYQDEDGCPDTAPLVVLTNTGIEILDKVYFDFNKSTIQERSYALLDEVVRVLDTNPQLTLVRIEGHTDKIGTRAYNVGLSDRRAKAVLKYLVSKGTDGKRVSIDPKRLAAKGYGFDFPIAPNTTQDGRDLNRRVEFNIIEIDGKPNTNQVIRTKPK